MDLPRLIFLGLTVTALAFPVRRMVQWTQENGLDMARLVADLTAGDAVRSVTGAVLIPKLGSSSPS